jgi:hypothetical protein
MRHVNALRSSPLRKNFVESNFPFVQTMHRVEAMNKQLQLTVVGADGSRSLTEGDEKLCKAVANGMLCGDQVRIPACVA